MISRSSSSVLALAVVACLGVSACTSQPGARTVAEDQIEALKDVTAEQKQCMLAKLEGYTSEELDAVARGNESLPFESSTGIPAGATEEFTAFVEDLGTCVSAG